MDFKIAVLSGDGIGPEIIDQAIKVINALDRASSVTEVKNTYETLKESFNATKAPLKESIGFASQAAGVAPKGNIVDSDPFVNRWKTLAGIK